MAAPLHLAIAADGSADRRWRSLDDYFARDPALAPRFARLRRHAFGIAGSNYDISDICNLRCEGCLYFEGADRIGHGDSAGDDAWEALFRSERARGINYAYFSGAEPALRAERLRRAAAIIPRGVVFTNGTVRIDERLPYALHISLWGDEAETPSLRGANSFAKAFRLFGDDPRARFIFTANARNIESAWTIAERCAREGALLSFSIFSPTELYRAKLGVGAGNDGDYFRISRPEDNLVPGPVDLARIHATLDAVADRYPRTVVYSRAYNRWVTDPDGLYRIDPFTGWATDCGTRNSGMHRHVRTDLSFSDNKCCSPNIDCRDCRVYGMASGTAVSRFRRFATTYDGFRDWLDIAEQWSRLFLRDFAAD